MRYMIYVNLKDGVHLHLVFVYTKTSFVKYFEKEQLKDLSDNIKLGEQQLWEEKRFIHL